MTRWAAQATAITLVLVAPACRSDSQATTTGGTEGSITVFAAASLTEPLGDLEAELKRSLPNLAITYNFAGSGTLVAQVQQGAPADVVATADAESMARLRAAGVVEMPIVIARNKLEILVERGNPKGIASLADLSRTDISLVLGDETVPAGRYAAKALLAAGVTVKPVSKEANVKAAVAKVTGGEADVTVVYVSDVKAAGAKAQGVEIPDAQNVVAEYPIAIVAATTHRAAAAAFVEAVVHGRGQEALRTHGFLPAA